MPWKNYSKVFKIKGTISHVPQIEDNFSFCLTMRNVRYGSPNNMQSSQFLSFFYSIFWATYGRMEKGWNVILSVSVVEQQFEGM